MKYIRIAVVYSFILGIGLLGIKGYYWFTAIPEASNPKTIELTDSMVKDSDWKLAKGRYDRSGEESLVNDKTRIGILSTGIVYTWKLIKDVNGSTVGSEERVLSMFHPDIDFIKMKYKEARLKAEERLLTSYQDEPSPKPVKPATAPTAAKPIVTEQMLPPPKPPVGKYAE